METLILQAPLLPSPEEGEINSTSAGSRFQADFEHNPLGTSTYPDEYYYNKNPEGVEPGSSRVRDASPQPGSLQHIQHQLRQSNSSFSQPGANQPDIIDNVDQSSQDTDEVSEANVESARKRGGTTRKKAANKRPSRSSQKKK